MQHEPKLNVYTIRQRPIGQTENSNRSFFKKRTRHLRSLDEDPTQTDELLFLDFFKVFISEADKPEMFRDEKSKKSMTANQPKIDDSTIPPNILPLPGRHIIHGIVEGGRFGRKRKKTNISDKAVKDEVQPNDAITEDFYFLIFLPPGSNRGILMIQSYSDETIDTVIKDFWEKLMVVPEMFKKPKIERFTPKKIITDFKEKMEVSELSFTTYVAGETLFDNAITVQDKRFKVSIRIEAKDGDLSVEQVNQGKSKILGKTFNAMRLFDFRNKKGKAIDSTTGKPSSFELDSDFEVMPTIYLSKYINFTNTEEDMDLIKDFCMKLLTDEIIPEVYPEYAVQNR